MSSHVPAALMEGVDRMVALGGDLYVYGGSQTTALAPVPEREGMVRSDILVARARDGIVNQPWKRLVVSESAPFLQFLQASCYPLHLSAASAYIIISKCGTTAV